MSREKKAGRAGDWKGGMLEERKTGRTVFHSIRFSGCMLFGFGLLVSQLAAAEDSTLKTSIRARSEGALLDESTALQQAEIQARNPSAGGLELRPGFSEDEGSLALRINLPGRWTQRTLREQLRLAAESEQLRVEDLEWQELLSVYRDLCTYRMLNKQRSLYDDELNTLSPYLAQADSAVEVHQLAVVDRAKLYSLCLDLMNDREKIEIQLLSTRQQLYVALGTETDLDACAGTAVITPPTQMQFDEMLEQALASRADCRRLDTEVQALESAAAVARSEEGFRFKHIQPEYQRDLSGEGEDQWSISAAFSLPWGHRNPDVAVVERQKALTLSARTLQRQLLRERLQILLNTCEEFSRQMEQRSRAVRPLLAQLEADVRQMDGVPLSEVRDWMSIRERILAASLQTARIECERERIAVELAEQLGTLNL